MYAICRITVLIQFIQQIQAYLSSFVFWLFDTNFVFRFQFFQIIKQIRRFFLFNPLFLFFHCFLSHISNIFCRESKTGCTDYIYTSIIADENIFWCADCLYNFFFINMVVPLIIMPICETIFSLPIGRKILLAVRELIISCVLPFLFSS